MNDFVDLLVVGILTLVSLQNFSNICFYLGFLTIYFLRFKRYHHYPNMELLFEYKGQVTLPRNHRKSYQTFM